MSKESEGQPVVRVRFSADGEQNCYLIIGSDFCEVKFPDENDPTHNSTKLLLNSVCDAVVKGMTKLNGGNNAV